MDAFYASVEQRDFPELRGKPIAVGSPSTRGVVTTASYEARKFNIRSAMPSVTAKRLCPDLIFVPPRFDVYQMISKQIREIFLEYTDLVEPLSLDEAFLDVTHNKKNMPSATLIAREIKLKIKQKTGLTASAGISINKFLAKIASEIKKPDGLFLIPPEKAVSFTENLAIEKFFGVGKKTAQKMHEMGIRTGFDLKQWSEVDLVRHFGKLGKYFFLIARAQDDREVNPHRIRKSLGAENTFSKDLINIIEVRKELGFILEILIKRMKLSDTSGKTLTLKVKYADFRIITRSVTKREWISEKAQIKKIFENLLPDLNMRNGIRLLGLTISNLNLENEKKDQDHSPSQLTLDF